MQNVPLIYFWVINYSKTLWPTTSTFIYFHHGSEIRAGHGSVITMRCQLARLTQDWLEDVCHGARSCDCLAVTCELIQYWQPGVFFLSRGLSIGLFGLPHSMEAELQERLFKETGSGSWLVRPCLEFGTVSFVLYSIAKAFKEPVRFPGWDKRPSFFLVCAC